MNSIHNTPAWSLPFFPAIIRYWVHQKEKLALICENMWEALSQLESGYIPPPKDGNCLPRNIQAWRPLETRGNQASCSQQCNQCILWAGPTSNQVRVGRDWRWVCRDKTGLRIRIPWAPYSLSAWYSLEGESIRKINKCWDFQPFFI